MEIEKHKEPVVGGTIIRYTYSGNRGTEKIARFGEDLGSQCFYTESGEAYKVEFTRGKGHLNSGNAAFWAVVL